MHRGWIIWLDADILVLGEPTQLLFHFTDPHGAEFVACASDKNIGTAQDDDKFAPYFRAACAALGLDFASLPYVVTETERIPIRAYWNSGVYAFRSETGLADLHHKYTIALLTQRIASHESKLFFSDQIALGLAAHSLGLRYDALSLNCNYSLQPQEAQAQFQAANGAIRILHYHGCLWPTSFGMTCDALDVHYPQAAKWLRTQGPLGDNVSAGVRIQQKLLQLYRQRQYISALRRARFY
jgi:lipopolysaccharide biosynthesis glycosyltransferase